MAETRSDASTTRRRRLFFIIVGAAVLATIVGVALLMNIFERKQEARNPFYRVVELTDDTEDPAVWGKNFPLQYDDYKRTVDQVRTRYGGSEALPHTPTQADPRSMLSQSKIEEDPRLTCIPHIVIRVCVAMVVKAYHLATLPLIGGYLGQLWP